MMTEQEHICESLFRKGFIETPGFLLYRRFHRVNRIDQGYYYIWNNAGEVSQGNTDHMDAVPNGWRMYLLLPHERNENER